MASEVPPSVWEAIRERYVRGEEPCVIAKDYAKPSAAAISSKAYRDDWKALRQRASEGVRDALPTHVVSAVLGEVERRLAEQLADVDSLRVLLRAQYDQPQDAAGVASLVRSARGLVDMERLCLGIREPDATGDDGISINGAPGG